jgi:hypothetical protein
VGVLCDLHAYKVAVSFCYFSFYFYQKYQLLEPSTVIFIPSFYKPLKFVFYFKNVTFAKHFFTYFKVKFASSEPVIFPEEIIWKQILINLSLINRSILKILQLSAFI